MVVKDIRKNYILVINRCINNVIIIINSYKFVEI